MGCLSADSADFALPVVEDIEENPDVVLVQEATNLSSLHPSNPSENTQQSRTSLTHVIDIYSSWNWLNY